MLARLNPLTVFAVALVWLAATIIVYRLSFQLGTVVFFASLLLVAGRVGILRLCLLMVPFALFGFGFLTTNVLFRQENSSAVAVFSSDLAGGDALYAGLVLFTRALAGGAVSLFFALTIEPGRLVRAMMVTLRMPASLAFALFSAMQIVPSLLSKLQDLRIARAVRRGAAPGRLPSPTELGGLLVPLLAYAIRRAGRTAIAMEARGFVPGRARTSIDAPGFSIIDAGFFVAMLLALTLLVTATLLSGAP